MIDSYLMEGCLVHHWNLFRSLIKNFLMFLFYFWSLVGSEYYWEESLNSFWIDFFARPACLTLMNQSQSIQFFSSKLLFLILTPTNSLCLCFLLTVKFSTNTRWLVILHCSQHNFVRMNFFIGLYLNFEFEIKLLKLQHPFQD